MKRTSMKQALSLVVLLLGCASLSTAQTPYLPDHFKCYHVLSNFPLLSATISLADEFTSGSASIRTAEKLCNPVMVTLRSDSTAINHADDDLTFYLLEGAGGSLNKDVVVDNLFGQDTITILAPRYLAVPTVKGNLGSPSTDLDHFQCYDAAGNRLRKRVGLADEWQHYRAAVMFPQLYCTSVEMTYNTVVTPIPLPVDRLVCYNISQEDFSLNQLVTNQFGAGQDLALQAADLLCVPSTLVQVLPPAQAAQE